ncbi:recombinase family protein [Mesorhizobium sp. RP14(2022)]|uniref:Recombinase family protein n=1 Tax=Mesorhizobium liriopis TaxID=2953882 RepID=A0ABT1C6M0_9HYPH|nr:recombinase family protein [Mesorhizobium liriopis]MCO6050479.1 recombinase family protein [Mesorhizobium liriopis]
MGKRSRGKPGHSSGAGIASSSTGPNLRCAVYTRKSSEEGLGQAFNSLDAQREACSAYVLSQAGLGWTLVHDHYDDGGLSGGTLERPALQRLLQDIRDRRIDVVVVYKIDRLTRSLMDFARIVDVFDQHNVSFVSVTQAFNTTTSMGRLTLNVLLSFAQFEREVTAERIRDKIAASKKKGMWMGGRVPLGYRVEDRKLIVEPSAADRVRNIFERYCELRSVSLLADKLREDSGEGTRPLSRGQLYHLLANPIYVGKLRHKGAVHEGEHQGIIEEAVFARAQLLLAERAPARRARKNAPDLHLLTGIVFDEAGERLSPAHAANHGKRYRYYISAKLKGRRTNKEEAASKVQLPTSEGWRLPAAELEGVVVDHMLALLDDRAQLASWIRQHAEPHRIEAGLAAALNIKQRITDTCAPSMRRQTLQAIFPRVELAPGSITLAIDHAALVAILLGEDAASQTATAENCTRVTLPIALARRGQEARIVVEGTAQSRPTRDQALVDQIAKAHHYLAQLTDGKGRTIGEVAGISGVHRADISRILPLAFLGPAITAAIMTGRHPADLTARKLARLIDLPLNWQEQARMLGCRIGPSGCHA